MSQDTSHHEHIHITPIRTYLGVAGALLFLTAITVWVAGHDYGEWNLIVAMAVAATKAILVAMFFMHLLYDNKLYLMVFVGSILFLTIFIIFTMFDTLRRDDIYEYVEKPINPKAVIYEKAATGMDTTKAAVKDSTKTTTEPAKQ